jgi:hypothetical protein
VTTPIRTFAVAFTCILLHTHAIGRDRIDLKLVERGRAESETLWRKGFTLGDTVLEAELNALLNKLVAEKDVDPAVHLNIQVFRSPDLNAFAMPDGSIFLFVGLLAQLDSMDELAFVVAHEAQHAMGWHAQKNIAQYKEKQAVFEILSIAITVALATSNVSGAGLIDSFSQLGLSLVAAAAMTGYGRDLERESDLMGLQLMGEAGYDACGSVGALHAMLEEREDQDSMTNLFWGTHPLVRDRIEYVQEALKQECAIDSLTSEDYAAIKWPMMKMRARLWNIVGEPRKAIASAKSYAEVIPDDPEILCALGDGYRAVAKPDTLLLALEAYHRALELAVQEFREPLLGISLAAEASKDTLSAITYLERYLAEGGRVPKRRALWRKCMELKQAYRRTYGFPDHVAPEPADQDSLTEE